MPSKKWVIDLTDGFYDHLEDRLSQFLGLKVLMIRGWKAPQTCDYSFDGTTEIFSSPDPEVQELTRARLQWMREISQNPDAGPDPLEEAVIDSLRTYLLTRDPDIADQLYDEELLAIAKNGHLTLRDSNVLPPNAVILFDPMDKIKTRNQVIDDIFNAETDNIWTMDHKDRQSLRPGALVEKFDIEAEKYRAAVALQRIRYALINQDEFDRNRKEDKPFFYSFADMNNPRRQSLATTNSSFTSAQHYYSLSRIFAHQSCPVDDTAMHHKLTQAEAAAHLYKNSGPAFNIFARLYDAYNGGAMTDLNEENIRQYEQKMRNALRTYIETTQPDSTLNSYVALRDPRVAIPVFREVRKTLDFDRPGEIFLETIWKGVERYFPTLAQAPVPVLKPGHEPPRDSAGYQRLPRPPAPRPQ